MSEVIRLRLLIVEQEKEEGRVSVIVRLYIGLK